MNAQPTPKAEPNPGSREAIDQSCLCPHFANRKGEGDPKGIAWTIRRDCPIHGIDHLVVAR